MIATECVNHLLGPLSLVQLRHGFFETIEAMPSAVGAPVGRGAAIGGAAGRGAAPGAPIGAGAGRIGGIAPGEAAGRIPAGGWALELELLHLAA